MSDSDLKTYVSELFMFQYSGGRIRELIAYLNQVLVNDKKIVASYRRKLSLIRDLINVHSDQTFDYTKNLMLFVNETPNFTTLLSTANQDVVLNNKTFNQDLVIGANGVHLDGKGTCIVNGSLHITGSNIVVRNMTFNTNTHQEGVLFLGASSNIKLLNCVFNGAGYAPGDGFFFYGEHNSGDLTIQDCQIKNYGGWMCIDGSTTSAAPSGSSDSLRTVVFKGNTLSDCAGSIAFRAHTAAPNRMKSCTLENNTFIYENALQNPLFWSAMEVNNCLRTVCKGNKTVNAARIVSNERGFLQVWSKAAAFPWTVDFQNNQIQGFDYAIQIAGNSNFYSCDSSDDRNILKSETGEITDVLFGLSLFYPWDTAAWDVVDQAVYPNPPPTNWADALANRS